MSLLPALARNGRWILLAGLVIGIAIPPLSRAMTPLIVPLIVASLFLAALRTDPLAGLPRGRDWSGVLGLTLGLQLALPLVVAAGLHAAGVADTVAGIGAVLVLAAAPISGTPGLAVLTGANASVALRQMVIATALLPLTAVPVLATLPVFPDAGAVVAGALRLLVIVVGVVGLALAIRTFLPRLVAPPMIPQIDGVMTVVMGVLVVGMMGAVGPALMRGDPALPALVALSFALNLIPALAVFRAGRARLPAPDAAALAIAAGNRNLALFLAALPPETLERILLFLGCYQIPMYLGPLILPRLFRLR
ncbi:hypothetical protein [Rhodovulum adriaticum]|uniref:BASS family bile acid:Na+ symporter n=1 Tax=Rhodovulum adriaticum TaxID=35804 RepID=A0A4R2NYN4_RHOAD|nr:hypothetical protein [Rhodovulum adriaticum]MBK1634938.1 hypothetical protein [Rhodovulum adriaticum]TCP27409.1 hypothetical protein EV656_101315 [Rhodovulum adriaticum]